MFTHNITRSWSRTGETISQAVAIQAEQEVNMDFSVPGSTTNQLNALVLDVSQVKSVYVLSDGAITLKTNDSSSPATTISVAANTPICWTNLDPNANPIGTTDVTALYITNAGTGAAAVKIRILVDPTV